MVVEQSDHSPSFAGNPAISLSGVHMNFLLHTGGRKDKQSRIGKWGKYGYGGLPVSTFCDNSDFRPDGWKQDQKLQFGF